MGRPEMTATRAKRDARSASSAGTPGRGRAPTGSGTMAESVPSKSRNSALCAGSAASGSSSAGSAGDGGGTFRQASAAGRQAPDVAARSWPMITITSTPDVGLTGVEELIGST